jgi:hypothetical protein
VKLFMSPSIRGVTGMLYNRLQRKLSSNGLLQIFSQHVLCYFAYSAYLICIQLRRQIFRLRQKSKSCRPAINLLNYPAHDVCLFIRQLHYLYPARNYTKIMDIPLSVNFIQIIFRNSPVTVAQQSKACIVFDRSEAGIMGSNPTQGMDVWCLCVCVRFSVFLYRWRPCDELITRPRGPTEYLRSSKPKWNGEFHGGRPRPKLGL